MINQDTLPNFTIDQKDDVWELSINKTKAEAESYNVQDKEDMKNNVINNLIKSYPKDPLITSYISPQPSNKATPSKNYPKEPLIITNKSPTTH